MKITFIIFVSLFTSCKDKVSVQENLGDKQWEGWAGPPHNPNLKPHDYFYTTLS